MTEVNIDAANFEEGIDSISAQLNTQWNEKCGFYTTEFRNDSGSGNLACYDLTGGKGLISVEATFVTDLSFNLNYKDLTSPVKIFLNLGNSLTLSVNNTAHEIKKNEFTFNVIRENHEYKVLVKKNSEVRFLVLFINEGNFMDSLMCNLKSSAPKIAKLLTKSKKSRKVYYDKLRMNQQLIEAVSSILINNMKEMEKRLFLEGQFNTILSLILDKASPKPEKSFQSHDIKLIEEAKEILDQEFTSPPIVKELAKRVGTNPNKLHSLFKDAYGTTINKYVLSKKMELGRSLLIENNAPIGNIAQKVGIQNPSYFTKKFKHVYGVLPSTYQNDFVEAD